MLLNNRGGPPVLAKVASCNRDDGIFAFGIFYFFTSSSFPPWCQERFLSTSTGRRQIRTAFLYLCYLYKKVSLPTAFIFYQRQCTAQQNIYQSFQFPSPFLLCCHLTFASEVIQIKKGHFCFLCIANLRYKKKKFTREMIWKQPTLLPWLKFLDLERLPQVRFVCKSPFAPRKCM